VKPAGASGEIAPGMLIRTIEVYAHAQERLIGTSFPASVYSVMTFDLPPGSVLRSEVPSEDEATWTGAAIVSSHGTGFDVEATSNTPTVVLKSSRTFGMSKTASRRIDLGHHAQFMKDPNILWIQLLAGVFLVLLRLVLSIVGFFTEDAGGNFKAPAPRDTTPSDDSPSPGAVAQFGHQQALAPEIVGHMVDPSGDTGQRGRPLEHERRRGIRCPSPAGQRAEETGQQEL
jgi:hypothetical protein